MYYILLLYIILLPLEKKLVLLPYIITITIIILYYNFITDYIIYIYIYIYFFFLHRIRLERDSRSDDRLESGRKLLQPAVRKAIASIRAHSRRRVSRSRVVWSNFHPINAADPARDHFDNRSVRIVKHHLPHQASSRRVNSRRELHAHLGLLTFARREFFPATWRNRTRPPATASQPYHFATHSRLSNEKKRKKKTEERHSLPPVCFGLHAEAKGKSWMKLVLSARIHRVQSRWSTFVGSRRISDRSAKREKQLS